MAGEGATTSSRRGAVLLLTVFVLGLMPRLVNLHQPLLEGFIDRQVHTAMIARNLLDSGPCPKSSSSHAYLPQLFFPQIDVGPFPAYYMLEFPAYPVLAGLVWRLSGIPLDVSGRLVSALAIALAGCFLFDMVRRRDSWRTGYVAALVFAFMPVTIRYGRAFQPDASMIALLVFSIWAMDRWAASGRGVMLWAAACGASLALLLKVIAAYALIPLAYLAWSRLGWKMFRRWQVWLALVAALLPSLLWYCHAYGVASGTTTVSTPFWHVHKWIDFHRFVEESSYRQLIYYVGLRVLTPLGVLLMALGVATRAWPVVGRGPFEASTDRPAGFALFHIWLLALLAYLPILVRKLDHEHYYLALAPVAAVFIGRAIEVIRQSELHRRLYVGGRGLAWLLAGALLVSDVLGSRSTFSTPSEWRHVIEAARAIRQATPDGSLIAGHSAVLFYAGRRGFPMAYRPHEVRYLFGTWAQRPEAPNACDLLAFYRQQGAAYFVELLGTGREMENQALFRELRSDYEIVAEQPGKYLVAALRPPPSSRPRTN